MHFSTFHQSIIYCPKYHCMLWHTWKTMKNRPRPKKHKWTGITRVLLYFYFFILFYFFIFFYIVFQGAQILVNWRSVKHWVIRKASSQFLLMIMHCVSVSTWKVLLSSSDYCGGLVADEKREQLTAGFSFIAKLYWSLLDLVHNMLSPNSEVNPQRHLKDSLKFIVTLPGKENEWGIAHSVPKGNFSLAKSQCSTSEALTPISSFLFMSVRFRGNKIHTKTEL